MKTAPKTPRTDERTTIMQLREIMRRFVARRQWQKFHKPKNLSMSLAVEAAELMEHFQWLTHDEADELLKDNVTRGEVADEMADVMAFLLSLANATRIDLSESFVRKMAANERKYPASKVRGVYRRPKKASGRGKR